MLKSRPHHELWLLQPRSIARRDDENGRAPRPLASGQKNAHLHHMEIDAP